MGPSDKRRAPSSRSPRPTKSRYLIFELVCKTDLASSGSRKEQETDASRKSKLPPKQTRSKRASFPEAPSQMSWEMTENIFARVDALEKLNTVHSSGNAKASQESKLPPRQVGSKRVLWKMMETIFARVDTLENFDIVHSSGNTNVSHGSKLPPKQVLPKRVSFPEAPPRLWKMMETIFARVDALESFDTVRSSGNGLGPGSPPIMSIAPAGETGRSLFEMLEAAHARVSILEKRRDIIYTNAFKASSGRKCIVRGCSGKLSRPDHLARHLNATSTPEHRIAAIILLQKECLQCNKRWSRPCYLLKHEISDHNESHTSRIDVLRPFFDWSSSRCLA